VEGEEEEELDPRWELIRQLVEYKKFKEMAGRLQTWETRQEATFPRPPGSVLMPPPTDDCVKIKVTLMDLVNAVNVVLDRLTAADDAPEIVEERWSVSQKIASIRQLIKERSRISFSELFAAAATRFEVVATFLALLELVRLKQAVVAQSEAFGEIEITHGTEINN